MHQHDKAGFSGHQKGSMWIGHLEYGWWECHTLHPSWFVNQKHHLIGKPLWNPQYLSSDGDLQSEITLRTGKWVKRPRPLIAIIFGNTAVICQLGFILCSGSPRNLGDRFKDVAPFLLIFCKRCCEYPWMWYAGCCISTYADSFSCVIEYRISHPWLQENFGKNLERRRLDSVPSKFLVAEWDIDDPFIVDISFSKWVEIDRPASNITN